jgi:hypothetical protein
MEKSMNVHDYKYPVILKSKESKVTIEGWERELCEETARQRNKNKRGSGIRDQQINKEKSSLQIDIEGFYAEYAFCKMINSFPDFVIHNKPLGFDSIINCMEIKSGAIQCNVRVDVKSNHFGNLWIKKSKPVDACDIFVTMIMKDFPVIYFGGWEFSVIAIKESNLSEDGQAYKIKLQNIKLSMYLL